MGTAAPPVSCGDSLAGEETATSSSLRRSCQEHPFRRLPRTRRRRRSFKNPLTVAILAAAVAATAVVLVIVPSLPGATAAAASTTLAFHVANNARLSSYYSSTPSRRSRHAPSRRRKPDVPVPVPVILFNAAGKDEVTVNLERARAVLEKAKQKLASRDDSSSNVRGIVGVAVAIAATATMVADRPEDESDNDNLSSATSSSLQPALPFFATREAPPNGGSNTVDNKRRRVIKSIDESTGLITTDGEKMARLSEEEAWEARSLLEVFENEISDKDVYSATSQQLASRDVAASIWNLRRTLQSEDYKKIFDEKNRFIGEGN